MRAILMAVVVAFSSVLQAAETQATETRDHEAYVLKDGTVLEGKVMRLTETQVTIRTAKGIASHRLTEFDVPSQEKLAGVNVVPVSEIPPGGADAIVLRDGTVVTGRVIRVEAGRVTLQTPRGITGYSADELDQATRERLRLPEAPAAVAAKPRPNPSAFPSASRPEAARGVKEPGSPSRPAGEKAASEFPFSISIVVVGAVLVSVAYIWLVVAGFSVSPGWGIALILFNGLAGLAFLILHFDRAIRPLVLYAVGIGLMVGSFFLFR